MLFSNFSLLFGILFLIVSCSVNDSTDESLEYSLAESSQQNSSSVLKVPSNSLNNSSMESSVSSMVVLNSSDAEPSSSSSVSISSSSLSAPDTLRLSQTIRVSSSSQGLPILRLTGNINQDSKPKGSILNTQAYLVKADLASPLGHLKNRIGESINLGGDNGLIVSAKLSMSVNGNSKDWFLPSEPTLTDLIDQINGFLSENSLQSRVTLSANSSLEVQVLEDLSKFNLSVDVPLAKQPFAVAFSFPSLMNPGDFEYSDALFVAAKPDALLSEAFDSNGEVLGLTDFDEITVEVHIGSRNVLPTRSILYQPGITTINDLLDLIRHELRLPTYALGVENQLSVSINEAGSDDFFPDGTIVIWGSPGEDFAIRGLKVRSKIHYPGNFNNNNFTTVFQVARNLGYYKDTVNVVDVKTRVSLYDLEVGVLYKDYGSYGLELRTLSLEAQIIKGWTGQLNARPDGTFSLIMERGPYGEIATTGSPDVQFEIDLGLATVNNQVSNKVLTHFENQSSFSANWVLP